MRFIALVVPAGVAAGLGALALMELLHFVEHTAWSYRTGDFLHGVERTSSGHRLLVLSLAGVLAGCGALGLRRLFRVRDADTAKTIWISFGRLPLWPTLSRAVLSITTVGLGASLGREAAPQQAGAALASRLSDRAGRGDGERRLLVACGASAGWAAVYNVPLGGALFAVEVLLGSLTLAVVLPAMAAALIATAIAGVALPIAPTYHIPSYPLLAPEVVWAALVGPLAGLASVLWVRWIAAANARRPDGWRLAIMPVAVFVTLGALAIPYPQLLGNGKDVVQLAFVGSIGVASSRRC